jgi:hypothetical protein
LDWATILTTILAILKFTGIGLSMAFGVLALLTKYRDDDGNITRWGRFALIGVFASGLSSAAAQSVELILSNKARRDAEHRTQLELEANTRLLTQINRGLNPLSDVRASFWLRVSLEHPELRGFVKRFVTSVNPLIARWESDASSRGDALAYPSSKDMNGKVLTVNVRQDSPLFPQEGSERFAYTVFENTTITMRFYRTPIEIRQFPHYGAIEPSRSVRDPDIEMYFEQDDASPWDINLEYEPATGTFRVRGSSIFSDPNYWRSSGEIVSLLDLAGAQVFITAGHTLVSFEEREKRVHPEVDSVVLDVGSRKGLRFRGARLIAHKDPVDGQTIYEYRFPKSFEAAVAELQ